MEAALPAQLVDLSVARELATLLTGPGNPLVATPVWEGHETMHPFTKIALSTVPPWRGAWPDTIHLYTDGSDDHGRAGWGIAISFEKGSRRFCFSY